MKLHQLVKEWLSEFKTDNDNYANFFNKYFGNKVFYSKLSAALENKSEIESICHQIYKFAHMKNPKINMMLLDFLPIILQTYLILSFTNPKSNKEPDNGVLLIRTCLFSVYKLLKSKQMPEDNPERSSKPLLFIPTFTDGSIIHSPIGRPDLDMLNYSLTVCEPPRPIVPNTHELVAGLVQLYSESICDQSPTSQSDFCTLASRMASLTRSPRISVSSESLAALLTGLNCLMSPDAASQNGLARHALAAVELRANYELMPSVIVVANAICNSLLMASGESTATVASENVITNASFRPEKIAEDLEHLLVTTTTATTTSGVLQNIHYKNHHSNNNNNVPGNDGSARPIDLGDIGVHFRVPAPVVVIGNNNTTRQRERQAVLNGGDSETQI